MDCNACEKPGVLIGGLCDPCFRAGKPLAYEVPTVTYPPAIPKSLAASDAGRE